jgi:methyl coenzyme M reductase subunit D
MSNFRDAYASCCIQHLDFGYDKAEGRDVYSPTFVTDDITLGEDVAEKSLEDYESYLAGNITEDEMFEALQKPLPQDTYDVRFLYKNYQ